MGGGQKSEQEEARAGTVPARAAAAERMPVRSGESARGLACGLNVECERQGKKQRMMLRFGPE